MCAQPFGKILRLSLVKCPFVLCLPILFCLPLHAYSKPFTQVIHQPQFIYCYDGDTCTFRDRGKKIKVRLFGVDAPEKKQTFGKESRDALTSWIQSGKNIELDCNGKSYKRLVCKIVVDGKSASEYMVRMGYAWDSPHYSKGKFKMLEEEAKKKKLGLWAKPNPVRPECFRNPKRKGC